jgi:hypothetical protein
MHLATTAALGDTAALMELSTSGRDRTRRPRVVLAREISEIAGSVRTRLPDLVERVVQRLLAEIEFYRDRELVSIQDLRDSVASDLESMVARLTTDQPPDLSAPRATGRRRAQQGTPLADILHAYRIGSPSCGRRSSTRRAEAARHPRRRWSTRPAACGG